jgi:tetratricopeptide (TPR) repeat protein
MNAIQDAAPEQADTPLELPDLSRRLSDAQVNTIHTAAYHLSKKGEHDQASALFGLLGLYRPTEPMYAQAVGVCFRKMGRYEDAIRGFARAMQMRPNDFGPAFMIVECMMLLGKREEARDVLQIIAGAAGQDGQVKAVERATAMMQLVDGAAQ